MAKIKFVYFDLGGVVMLDFSGTGKWEELRKELGISSNRAKEFKEFWVKREIELCSGKKNTEDMLPLIVDKFGAKIPDNYSLLVNGFVDRFEADPAIWPVINEIHSTSRIGLLTNLYPRMFEAEKEKGILPDVKWDEIINSSIVGYAKPERGIFRVAQEKAGASGDEILYIENTPMHIEAASKFFGWQTFLYDPTKPEKSSKDLGSFWRDLSLSG